MIKLYKHATDFYFKSETNSTLNIVAERLNVVTNKYENPTIIGSVEPRGFYIHHFSIDGKYRISYQLPLEGKLPTGGSSTVIKIDYIYLESYTVYLKQVVSNIKDFLCSGTDCCSSDGDKIEQGLYTINTLLGYFNLATNSNFNSYQLCNGSVLDIFVRKMFDSQRLEFLTEFTRASKMDCLTNDKLTIPLAKKIASVYFLALYFYEIYNQIDVENLDKNIETINNSFDIVAIKRCITKQGFDFETARKLFNEIVPIESIVNGIDKTFHLFSDINKDSYTVDIVPSDLYDLPKVEVLRNTIYIDIITLPVLGKLYYTDKDGNKTQIVSTGTYVFNLLSTEKITYEYNVLSDSITDLVLYNITSVVNGCSEEVHFNTLNFITYPYDYDVNSIPLNVTSIKVPTEDYVDFNVHHIFKLLKRKLDIYRIHTFSINIDTNKVLLTKEDTTPINNVELKLKDLYPSIKMSNVSLVFQSPVESTITVKDVSNNIITIPVFFRLANESEFTQEYPMFTINSLNPDITTITLPFYETSYPMFADTIEHTEVPQEFYFLDESSEEPLEEITLNAVTVPLPFPDEKVIKVTTGNNRLRVSKDYIIKNNNADIIISYNFTNPVNHITFGESELGQGVVKHAAWEKGNINTGNSYTYGIGEKKTYLEVYPHDRIRVNNPAVTAIDIIGTFKRINLNNTNIGNDIIRLATELEQRTVSYNIIFLPIYESSFPVYFLANSTNNTTYPSSDLYEKMYAKGILVNLGKNETSNPMPTNSTNANARYDLFNLHITEDTSVPSINPRISCEVIKLPLQGESNPIYADVKVYAQLEFLTETGWRTFKDRFFYNKVTSAKEEPVIETIPLQGLTPINGIYSFRLSYQGYNGRKVSNVLEVTPSSIVIKDFINTVDRVSAGIQVGVSDKLFLGKSLRLLVTADTGLDMFIQQRDITRTNNNPINTLITVPYLTNEVLDNATIYVTALQDGEYYDTKAITGIENKVSIIPEAEAGNSLAKEYSFSSSEFIGKDLLLYHILPDIPIPTNANTANTTVDTSIEVYISLDNIIYNKVAEDSDEYVDVPLSSVTGNNRFYVKSVVNYSYIDNTSKESVIFKSVETYSIIINLT